MYQGSCHCGDIAFEVQGELGDVIECNCSHCSRKGFLWWFLPRANLHLSSAYGGASYKFHTHKLDHRFCPQCGCQPFAYGTHPKTGEATVAVNVRCLEGVDLSMLKRVQFDGRHLL